MSCCLPMTHIARFLFCDAHTRTFTIQTDQRTLCYVSHLIAVNAIFVMCSYDCCGRTCCLRISIAYNPSGSSVLVHVFTITITLRKVYAIERVVYGVFCMSIHMYIMASTAIYRARFDKTNRWVS